MIDPNPDTPLQEPAFFTAGIDVSDPMPSSAWGLGPWIENYVRPLAERLARHLGDYAWEVAGSLGDSRDVSVHFAPPGRSAPSPMCAPDRVVITFVPCDAQSANPAIIGVRDFDTDTAEYPLGSAGERAGLNHPVVPVQLDTSAQRLAQFLTGPVRM